MLKRIPLVLAAWVLAASLTLLAACGKTETPKVETAPDTAAVLPDPPELEPIEEAFPEPEPAPEPAKPARNPDAGLSPKGAYTLQVGIYNSERQAMRMAEKLKGQGYPAYVAVVQDPTPALPGTYYRVRVGSFASSKAARAYGAANLAPDGIEYWADLKGRDSEPVRQVFKPRTLPAAAPAMSAPPATPPPALKPAPTPAPEPAKPAPTPPPQPAPTPEPAPTPAPPAPQEPAQDTKPAPQLPDW